VALLLPFPILPAFGITLPLLVLIILFTYFYTAITVNPNQMAEDMKKNGGFIPGVKPGNVLLSLLTM
jgi:preprotein translocase subunit SecY